MLGIDPQKERTCAALTDSVLVVAAEAEAVSDKTGGGVIRLKRGCPAWQRRVSRTVEGWESGDGKVLIMVGGFVDEMIPYARGNDVRFKVTADYGVDTGHESKFASEQSLTRDSHTHGRTPFVFPSDNLPSTLTRGLVARLDARF